MDHNGDCFPGPLSARRSATTPGWARVQIFCSALISRCHRFQTTFSTRLPLANPRSSPVASPMYRFSRNHEYKKQRTRFCMATVVTSKARSWNCKLSLPLFQRVPLFSYLKPDSTTAPLTANCCHSTCTTVFSAGIARAEVASFSLLFRRAFVLIAAGISKGWTWRRYLWMSFLSVALCLCAILNVNPHPTLRSVPYSRRAFGVSYSQHIPDNSCFRRFQRPYQLAGTLRRSLFPVTLLATSSWKL